MVFLASYVLFDDPEMNRIFTEQIRSYDKNNVMSTIEFVRMEGKEEGREEGRTEKELSVVLKLLGQPNFTDEQIADIVGVSVTFVEEVRKNKK